MGYAQLVIGPAGNGKSTYCSAFYDHCQTVGRQMHIVNMDPAAENFDYHVAMEIRELISLEDAMEELGLSPNGGLMYCMEHLEDNLDDWLNEELENYMEDNYLVFDCPSQIELFSHVPVLKNFVANLKRRNFKVCAVFLLDSQVWLISKEFGSRIIHMFLLLYPNRLAGTISLGIPFVPLVPPSFSGHVPEGFYMSRLKEAGRAESDFGRFDAKTVVRRMYILLSRPESPIAKEGQELLDMVDSSAPLPSWFS